MRIDVSFVIRSKKMTYTYEINDANKTITVVTEGDLVSKEAAEMGLTILLKAKELKYRIVFDYRLSKNRISIAEAYYWFSNHYDSVDSELKFIPSVYIANENDFEFFNFFELTCNNRGIPIKVFLDEETASKWLNNNN